MVENLVASLRKEKIGAIDEGTERDRAAATFILDLIAEDPEHYRMALHFSGTTLKENLEDLYTKLSDILETFAHKPEVLFDHDGSLHGHSSGANPGLILEPIGWARLQFPNVDPEAQKYFGGNIPILGLTAKGIAGANGYRALFDKDPLELHPEFGERYGVVVFK